MGGEADENGDGHVDTFDESDEFDPADLVTITDEDGQDIDCAIVAVIEHEGEEFALLARVEQLTSEDGDEIEMFIFRYEQDDEGNQRFSYVEEEAVYEAVRDEFSVLMNQE
jgi:uncharacterized protein YrzB (UPF0473 family)